MKKIILTAVVLGAALAARAAEGTKREFPADGIKKVAVQAGSGPIDVRAGARLVVEVVENPKPELCLLTMEAKDGVLVLKAENAKRSFLGGGENCGAGFRVTAPAALALDASAGSGDITVDGMSGETALKAGSGRIAGSHSGRVIAKSGSGGVSLKGLTSGAEVKAGSGDVKLSWAKAPAGSVDVKSGSGAVLLVFPPGTKLQARQISGSGSAVNTLGETPGAKLAVSVTTGSGDSTISAANP
jgi:hypothetical protein